MKPFALRKAFNRRQQAVDIAFRRVRFRSNPTQLVIEPTNRCNACCPICARNYWDERANPPAELEADTLKALEHFLLTADTVFAFGHGEPLVTASFWLLLERAKLFGCRAEFTTNGLALDEAAVDRLIDRGVEIVNISMDALEPGALRARRGLDVAHAERMFAYLARRKVERGAKYPEGGIAITVDRDNLAELPHLLAFAADLHVKSLLINHLVAWDPALHVRSAYHESDAMRRAFAELKAAGKKAGVAVVLPFEAVERGRCPHPLRMFVVRATGEVWPCCNAVFRNERYSFPVGNVHNQSLEAIWNGKPYQALRRAFLRRGPLPEHCRICPLFADELGSHLRDLRRV